MATTRISTDHPDLTPVFGPLDDEQQSRIVALLEAADARLSAVRDTLAEQTGGTWSSEGVVLDLADSGQTSIDVSVFEAGGTITFSGQLRPRDFFPSEERMWQPGRPPLVMSTDAWDVDGTVDVRYKTRVANRPYTILDTVVELEEKRYDSPVAAAEAFAALCDELADLALSREATVAAWHPEEVVEIAPVPRQPREAPEAPDDVDGG